jgi:hypothetical protein
VVDDARRAFGGQCGVIWWQATQGDPALDDTTAIGLWATQ